MGKTNKEGIEVLVNTIEVNKRLVKLLKESIRMYYYI